MTSSRKLKTVELQGFHAVKHAIRFGAEITSLFVCETYKIKLEEKLKNQAPNEKYFFEDRVEILSMQKFTEKAGNLRSRVFAVAVQKDYSLKQFIEADSPVLFIDRARNHENLGACIRACAALCGGGVLVSGTLDLWHKATLRGSAGLHFAVPVLQVPKDFSIKSLGKKIYAFDPEGVEMRAVFGRNSLLVFGSEDSGLLESIKNDADFLVRIPMNPLVSSMNLATSVAVGLSKTLQ